MNGRIITLNQEKEDGVSGSPDKKMRLYARYSLIQFCAAVPGFEPGNGGFKVRCLTTWRHRKDGQMLAHWRVDGKQDSPAFLQLLPPFQRPPQRDLVCVFQVATDRQPPGQPGKAHAGFRQPPLEVKSC